MENIDEALKMIMRPLMVSIMKQFGFKRDPNIREELRAEIQAAVESVLRKHDIIVEAQSGKKNLLMFEQFVSERIFAPTDDEGNLIYLKVGDKVIEYKKPNPYQPKREFGEKGEILSIEGAMAKVFYKTSGHEFIALKDLKKVK